MVFQESILKTAYRSNFTPGKTLPKISSDLDSVRSYQFEVKFHNLPRADEFATGEFFQGVAAVGPNVLSTAAKQVSPVGGAVDDIVVDRLNDKVYYPGKFTPENVTITFDNQLLTNATPQLWQWFRSIYDPLTGDMVKNSAPGGPGKRSFKCDRMTILELDNTNDPTAYVELYGVYPAGVRFSEKNYATNDFSTVEVTFRFDFLDYNKGFNYTGS